MNMKFGLAATLLLACGVLAMSADAAHTGAHNIAKHTADTRAIKATVWPSVDVNFMIEVSLFVAVLITAARWFR
jgi:hypothetical protein